MKKAILSVLAIAFASAANVQAGNLHVDVYSVDKSASKVEWYAAKVTGKHNGTINISKGEIRDNHGHISGSFEIDMNTISSLDLTDAAMKSKLENHLMSDDFFNAEKYPVSKFVITRVAPYAGEGKGQYTHTVTGNLTIRDKTNEISFPANIIFNQGKVSCTGTAVVDRSKYDVKFGSKSFFKDIGDKMIYDEFTIKFDIKASR
ncbi:MAG: YceI family protein [Bacteroidetes bacterium]|nr:MAG: YceI family protein [Bacteroidota bacterium]REK06469.1 MAG: YceI family protein [Bacteroidota bacterium]REK33235.1 MAG: YceI family protein [Bacteroidota bacterium]REK47072.1 MAG: YceI family protein [Bacteroidota bacterium]